MPSNATTKIRSLILRPHEARQLAEAGRVLVVREVKLVQFGPSDTPGYNYNFRRGPGGTWEDYRTAELMAKKCPFGPVGSTLWGRERWCPKGDGNGRVIWTPDGNAYEAYYYADGDCVTCLDGDGYQEFNKDGSEKSPWMSATSMPSGSSRFPRLRHVACEVTRAGDLTWEHVAAMGLPDGPDSIVKPGSVPIEYMEIKPADMVAQLHGIPADRWAWCSTIEKEATHAE